MMGFSGGAYTRLADQRGPTQMHGANPAVRCEIVDHDGLIPELERTPGEARRLLRLGLWGAAQIIRRAIVDGIRKGPKSGRIYKRGKGIVHRASAEGEYPAADTGKLMKSVQQVRVNDHTVDVESDAAYAMPLEYKPPERGGRPFISRGFAEKVEEATAFIAATLQGIFPGDRKATRR